MSKTISRYCPFKHKKIYLFLWLIFICWIVLTESINCDVWSVMNTFWGNSSKNHHHKIAHRSFVKVSQYMKRVTLLCVSVLYPVPPMMIGCSVREWGISDIITTIINPLDLRPGTNHPWTTCSGQTWCVHVLVRRVRWAELGSGMVCPRVFKFRGLMVPDS